MANIPAQTSMLDIRPYTQLQSMATLTQINTIIYCQLRLVIWLNMLIISSEVYSTTYNSHLGAALVISIAKYPMKIVNKISCQTYLTR